MKTQHLPLTKAVSRKDAKGAKTQRNASCKRVHRGDISYLCAFAPFASLRETACVSVDFRVRGPATGLVAPDAPNKIESSFGGFYRLSENVGQTAARLLRLVIRGGRKLVRDPGESTLIFRMAAWVSILSLLVKFQPLPRALQMVSVSAPRDSQNPSIETERKLARAIDLLLGTDLLIFKPTCWKRAAILHRYLALHGIATRIVFGIRKADDGAVDGHAWLEVAGKPILETTVPNYKVTYAFPSHDVCNFELSSLTNRVEH